MKQQLNSYLVKIITDFIIFCEFSNEEVIDPDSSIQIIENIAYVMQSMDDISKKELIINFNEIVKQYSKEHQEFVQNLPVMLGII